jgi:hypothetical protein
MTDDEPLASETDAAPDRTAYDIVPPEDRAAPVARRPRRARAPVVRIGRWQDVVLGFVSRTEIRLFDVMYRLPRESVDEQVEPGCATIGWLLWRLTRDLDRAASGYGGEPQRWLLAGWYTKWGMAPDCDETGAGHLPDRVEAFRSPGYDAIAGYHQMVTGQVRRFLWGPTHQDTATEDAEKLLVTAAMDGASHIGQAELLRGILLRRAERHP